jgi:TolB protein
MSRIIQSVSFRFLIPMAGMLALLYGCSKPAPVTVDPSGDTPRIGKRILFSVVYPDGTFGIDWCEHDGSRRQTLSEKYWSLESQPSGGRFLANKLVAIGSPENVSLAVINIADRKPTPIEVFPTDSSYYEALLSPDGSKVLLISGEHADSQTMTIMNLDGTGRQVLVDDSDLIRDPSFSPDGRLIAYISNVPDVFPDDWQRASIRIVGVDGSGDHELLDSLNTVRGGRVSWSPDGRRLAYTGFSGRESTVAVMNVDGSGRQNLTDGMQNDFDPAWSPDGSQIAFTTLAPFTDKTDIVVINSDGSGRRDVTSMMEDRQENARWSPDGGRLLFSSYKAANLHSDLGVVNLSSNTITMIANNVWGQGYWDYSVP